MIPISMFNMFNTILISFSLVNDTTLINIQCTGTCVLVVKVVAKYIHIHVAVFHFRALIVLKTPSTVAQLMYMYHFISIVHVHVREEGG